MPNYCNNTLKISCSKLEVMFSIMEMIFAPNKKGEHIYTMEKLLPMPTGFSTNNGYSNIGYYWCNTIWGTKWDVIEPVYQLEESSLILHYDTAWSPNIPWVKTLCKVIYNQVYFENNESIDVTVEHNYWELGMNFGGNMFWSLGEEFEYNEYNLEKYAYLYNKRLYNWLIEVLKYEPYNPEWEKFNLLLDKFANPNPENDLL